MAGIGKYEKGKKFTLKSGNTPLFKQMGSSPVKHDRGDIEAEKDFPEAMPDVEANKFHTEVIDGHSHRSEEDGAQITRTRGGDDTANIEEEEGTMLTKKYKK